MLVADQPRLAIKVNFPHRVVLVNTIVLRLVALAPAHEAVLMPEVPVDATEDRGGLHPHYRLVVQDAELAPDTLHVAPALVRMPTIDRALLAQHFEYVLEH